MPRKFIYALGIYLCFGSTIFCQKDTAYVQSYSHKLTISTRLFVRDYQIGFQNPAGGNIYFQNANLNTGIRIRYKKLGASLSLPLLALNKPVGGQPKHLGIGLNFYEPRFLIRSGIRRFQGFSQLGGDADLFRGDMRMWHGIIRGFYIVNHERYSLRSSFKLYERQKKSQGSWLLSSLISFQHLNTDSIAFPVTTTQRSLTLSGYRSFKAGLGGGYAYTLAQKRWFLTLAATGGGEFRYIRFVGLDQYEDRNQWRLSPRINLQFGCGYNGERFFVALNGFYLPGADFTEALNVRVEDQQLNLLVGWRFQPIDRLDVKE